MNETTKLPRSDTWVVGIMKDDAKEDENTWAIVGVYDEEEKAIEVCNSPDHFVGPLVMNETDTDVGGAVGDKSPWPGLWFPAAGANPWTEELIRKEKYPRSPGREPYRG